jgi:hypothetical protein
MEEMLESGGCADRKKTDFPFVEKEVIPLIIRSGGGHCNALGNEDMYQKIRGNSKDEKVARAGCLRKIGKWMKAHNNSDQRFLDGRKDRNEPLYGWKLDLELRQILIEKYLSKQFALTTKTMRGELLQLLEANNKLNLVQEHGGPCVFQHDCIYKATMVRFEPSYAAAHLTSKVCV